MSRTLVTLTLLVLLAVGQLEAKPLDLKQRFLDVSTQTKETNTQICTRIKDAADLAAMRVICSTLATVGDRPICNEVIAPVAAFYMYNNGKVKCDDLDFEFSTATAQLALAKRAGGDQSNFVKKMYDEIQGTIAKRVGLEAELKTHIFSLNTATGKRAAIKYSQVAAQSKGRAMALPWLSVTLDGVHGGEGIIELITAPLRRVSFRTMMNALKKFYTVLETEIATCALGTTAVDNNSYVNAVTGVAPKKGVKLDKIVDTFNIAIQNETELADWRLDIVNNPRDPVAKWYVVCVPFDWTQSVQANYGMALSRFSTDVVVDSVLNMYHSTLEGGKRDKMRTMIQKAKTYTTAHLPDEIKNNKEVIGLFSLLIEMTYYEGVYNYADTLGTKISDHDAKNQYDQMPKPNLPDIVRKLPASVRNHLKTWYTGNHATILSDIWDAIKDLPRDKFVPHDKLDAFWLYVKNNILSSYLTEIFTPNRCAARYPGETGTVYGTRVMFALDKAQCNVVAGGKDLPTYDSGGLNPFLSVVLESRPTSAPYNRAFVVARDGDYSAATFAEPPLWTQVEALQGPLA